MRRVDAGKRLRQDVGIHLNTLMMNRTSNKKVIPELKVVFAKGGPRAAIAFLNSLTSHRFTSLYRFDGEMLRNAIFYDRENPELDHCEDIPVLASFCVFVRDSGATFKTRDARHDVRLNNHPKQNTIQSYCGVPLLNPQGKMFGTICHFDFKPGHIEDLDVELLEYMATLLLRSQPEQPV